MERTKELTQEAYYQGRVVDRKTTTAAAEDGLH